jgi:hypothetical protein
MTHRGAVTGSGALFLAFALAAAAAGEEAYVGTVMVSDGASKPVAVPFTLTIREYTSDETALQLAQLLHAQGHAAAVAELAKREAGRVQLGDKLGFRACVIRQQPAGSGRIVGVVTDRPMHVSETEPVRDLPADAVGYLELRLGPGGEGEGRLLPAVKLVFDAQGYVAPESLGAGSWPASGVKPGR